MNVCLIPASPMNAWPVIAEDRIYLHQGSIHVATSPALISTIVGSSVAVCLWSPAAAGVSHFVLPRGGHDNSARYGNRALPALVDEMVRRGALSAELLAAVFGGAGELGQQNVREAMQFLSRVRIPVIRRDVSGHAARKLAFRTFDGSTIVRKL